MAVEIWVGCGISGWVGLKKTFTITASKYFPRHSLQTKRVWQLSHQCRDAGSWNQRHCSLGVHFTLSPHQICHGLHPCFHPLSDFAFRSLQCSFYRALKKHSSYAQVGEEMQERNLGTDPKSDLSKSYGSQWKTVILGIAAELLPSSTVLELLQVPPKSGPAFEHDHNTKKMWLRCGKSRAQFMNKSY